MLDVAAVRERLTPDTVVVHLAAKAGVRPSLADPVGYARVNVTGTAAVLEAARQAGRVADRFRIVLLGLRRQHAGTVPGGRGGGGAGVALCRHQAGGGAVAELGGSDLRFPGGLAPLLHGLRSEAAAGPGDSRVHPEDGRGQYPDPVRRRDPGARLHLLRRHHRGRAGRHRWTATAPVGVETFNLGGNRSIATEAMVAEIAAALGIKPKVEWAPMQPGDVQRTAADLTKSSAVLGYTPKTPFPEGIRRFVQWYREAYGRAD